MIRLIYYCFYCQDSNVTNLSIKLLLIIYSEVYSYLFQFSGISDKEKAFNRLHGENSEGH